ncbi:Variant surface glycoprotein, partial [Trypanosoma congolense IL3000]
MACFMNVVAVVILILLGFVRGQVEVAKDDNIEPFSFLCRIYNVAKNPPINFVDLQEADKIVEDIDALNRFLSEEKRHDEEEGVGNNSETQVKPTVTREAALAQLSLNQITQKAHKVLDEIEKMMSPKKIEKAKAEFNKVIFGDGGNEDNMCQATVNDMDNRSKACGPPGLTSKGESAGKNLVVDFFCLCAQRTDIKEGVDKLCGFYVGRIDSYYDWGEQGPWGSSTMWASIKGGCGKHMQQHPKSTGEARYILDQFLKHLKTGRVYRWGDNTQVEGSERKRGMLGTGVGTKSEKHGNGKDTVLHGKKWERRQTPAGSVLLRPETKWEKPH